MFPIYFFKENRREYEKRVAAIVEQSWMMTFPDEAESSLGKSKQNDNATGSAATTSGASRSGGNLNNDVNNPENHNSGSSNS
jgi:hypothetical protein